MDVEQHITILSRLSQQSLSVAPFLLAILALLYGAYLWAFPKPLPGIPYDKKAAKSILGNMPDIGRHLQEKGSLYGWFASQNAKYNSPVYQFWGAPFSKPSVILTDFQEIQDILLRRTKEFDRSHLMINVFAASMPHHHITKRTPDPSFRSNKELVRDLMSPAFLQATSAPEIYLKTMTLVKLWSHKAKAGGGRPFNARPDMVNACMDIINAAAFAFNDSLSGTKHQLDYLLSSDCPKPVIAADGSIEFSQLPVLPDLAAFITLIQANSDGAATLIPSIMWRYRMIADSVLRNASKRRDRVLTREIERSLHRMQGKTDDGMCFSALDNIIRRENALASKEKRKPDYYAGRIRDEIFGYVMAGHETTLTSLLWVLKLLADHQEVQQLLRDALRETITAAVAEARQPTVAEVTKTSCPYLDAVIEECLRVGNPARMIHREAMCDTTLLGHRIPKGTDIMLCNDGPGFKKPVIPVDDALRSESSRTKFQAGAWNPNDLHLFKPERWLAEGKKSGEVVFDPHAGPTLPFSDGPRGCFGRRLAYLEIRMVVVLLFWNFRFRKLEGEMASYDAYEGITTSPKKCYVSIDPVW